jgi:cell division protein ZipA
MNGRELVILLLGLAIVAVVLRGLYVAINARRGQIKLAIDKNIPQNVDLESLELAELPGGGARVVTRSLEEVNRQNNALDRAETKAQFLNLTDAEIDGHIPVLMDAVELSQTTVARGIPAQEYQQEVEVVEDFESESTMVEEPVVEEAVDYAPREQYGHGEETEEDDFSTPVSHEHSIGEDWDEDEIEAEIEADFVEPQVQQQHVVGNEGDSVSTSLDYGGDDNEKELDEDEIKSNVDTMSSIAPDYVEESEIEDEVVALSMEDEETTDDDSYEDHVESNFDDVFSEQTELDEQELVNEQEPEEEQPALFDADSSADDFSMSAGERIGVNPPSLDQANQSSLFEEVDETTEDAVDMPKSRSLFSLFGRKSKQGPESVDQATLETAKTEIEALPEDESDDVLFEEVPAQVDIEEFAHEVPVVVDQIVDEEIIDELDQKRAASLEIDLPEQKTQADEFEHSEVLVLNVTAKHGRVFAGDDLLQVLITSGLKFGDMNIFHKRLSREHQSTVIFSVANMLNPGTFDLNNMDEFTTLGISFFLALPTPINNLDAFEQMLVVAQEIRDTLGGDLKDDHRNGMTGQTIEHYRQRIRDFELRRLKAAAARG